MSFGAKIFNDMIIPRDSYLRQLIRSRNNGLVKTITGLRRCGKSVLLSSIFRDWLINQGMPESNIIYIAMDDRRNQRLCNPDVFLKFIESLIINEQDYVILVDEVQLIEDFVSVLLSLTHKSNCDVYVTGSNSKFLSSDIATEFRGRSDEIYIQPLTFSEFYEAIGGDKNDAWRQYYLYGGLPQLFTLPDDDQKSSYLSNLLKTVYFADLIERNSINNDTGLLTLVRILASSIGSPTNPSRISATFKSVEHQSLSVNTITKFIQYMNEAFLICEALRFDIKGRKYIGTETKYYFTDIGLRNSILGSRQLEENHIMENVIYNELKYRGFSVDVGMVDSKARDSEGKECRKRNEVDFVANKSNQRYYIQSAFRMDDEAKEEQEKKSLKGIPDSFKKIIVVKDDIEPYYDNDGFVRIGLFDFLLNKDSLAF